MMLCLTGVSMAEDRRAELEDDWDALRPDRPKRLGWQPPDLDSVRQWVLRLGRGGPPLLAVEGPSLSFRSEVYRWMSSLPVVVDQMDDWINKGVPQSLAAAGIRWSLLWHLLSVEEFLIEEPLRDLADEGERFTEFFRAIWEVRFLYNEGRNVRPLVMSLTRWASDSPLFPDDRQVLRRLGIRKDLKRRRDRYDLLFFLIALARQNECIERAVFIFDGLEDALEQPTEARRRRLRSFLELARVAEHWAKLGSPTGLLVGFSKQHESGFKRFGPKLYSKVQAALPP